MRVMQRISVHVPADLRQKISIMARIRNKAESEIIREALGKGLKSAHFRSNSAQVLLDLAKMAEAIPTQGKVPKDAVKNMDYYTWGGTKRE